MSEPIRLTIRVQHAETYAPTVDDLLAQIGDWNSILHRVEKAIAEDSASEIEWRVTGASKNSTLSFELTPFPRRHGMNIERRTQQVKDGISAGLSVLRSKPERPSYFTEQVLEKAERLFEPSYERTKPDTNRIWGTSQPLRLRHHKRSSLQRT
jgi:hypothetical protein